MPTGGGPAPCIDARRYQIASLIGGDGLSAALIGAETNPYNNPYILVRSSAMHRPRTCKGATKRREGRRAADWERVHGSYSLLGYECRG